MTLRACKYRFYSNTEQAEMLARTFGCVQNKKLAKHILDANFGEIVRQ